MTNGHIAGVARLLRVAGETRIYWVRGIGHVQTYHSPDPRYNSAAPSRPCRLTTWGTCHESPEAAIAYAVESYNRPETPWLDRTYERQEALMCGPGLFEQP
jgi:hypothetical protein